VNKETILKEIRRLAATNGGVAPGRLALETETGIRESAWKGVYWVKWNEAVKEAGLEPNKMVTAYSKEQLLEALGQLAKEIGHIPTEADIRMRARKESGFPTGKTFARLGSKPERIAHLLEYCRNRSGFEEVVVFSESALASLPKVSEDAVASSDGDGFVYLIKSGRHYKIGRTNDPDRRERELSYQTVDKNVRVHSIRTDDPSGIEAYWLRRFADKRVRSDGEWFALSANDVSAFRRRKTFM
jgi:hypothetical protein